MSYPGGAGGDRSSGASGCSVLTLCRSESVFISRRVNLITCFITIHTLVNIDNLVTFDNFVTIHTLVNIDESVTIDYLVSIGNSVSRYISSPCTGGSRRDTAVVMKAAAVTSTGVTYIL